MYRAHYHFCVSVLTLFLVGGFGSCEPLFQGFCDVNISHFLARMERAQIALSPWYIPSIQQNQQKERGLASPAEEKSFEMALRDRKSWENWAEENLVEVQRHADALEAEINLRDLRLELSEIAKELVVFHGFAQMGNAKEMIHSIALILERAQKVKSTTCQRGFPG